MTEADFGRGDQDSLPRGRRMRILYHHRTASRDGQAVHIDELIASLRARGHDVRVVAPAGSTSSNMGERLRWVHLLKRYSPRVLYELLELGYSLALYRRLARHVRDFRPDIVYERYNLYVLAGVLVRKRFGVPLLLEVNAPVAEERGRYGGLSLPSLARWAERTTWRHSDAVLPVTAVLAKSVADAGVPWERIEVLPNGVNREHFRAASTSDECKRALGLSGKLVLGFAGFVRDWHGVDRVLRWMAEPSSPSNTYLLVVGDGPARKDLERLAAELGLTGRMRITGVLDRAHVPGHVAAFDVALQPAVVPYASPLKLMEYLALGKAIVAPDAPNLREVLEHGRNAWLFDANSPAALAGALARVCRDPLLRARLGTEARETINRLNLTWDANAERVEKLALALLAKIGHPAAEEVAC